MIYFGSAGAQFKLSEMICLRAEFRYNWLKPKLRYKPLFSTVDQEGDLKLDHMQVRAGLAFYF